MKKKILIVPDRFWGDYSGAIAARILSELIIELGHNVSIYSTDVETDYSDNNITYYHRASVTPSKLYFNDRADKKEFLSIIHQDSPDVVFSIGSITNRSPVYIELAKKMGLKTIVLIFMQDFFCLKSYANTSSGECIECLDRNYKAVFYNKCHINSSFDYVKTFLRIALIERNRKSLNKIDYLLGSSYEQLEFYKRIGLSENKVIKIPLFFDINRLRDIKIVRGEYYVCIAQNRVEKGFHYLSEILKNYKGKNKILVLYPDKVSKDRLINDDIESLISMGTVIVKDNTSWNTGLSEELANSRGVIIPTIWPTTTEFALLEALGLKKPVFAFDIGIHKEIIKNGENGYITSIDKASRLSSYMEELNRNENLYNKISEGAYQLFKDMTNRITWLKIINRILL